MSIHASPASPELTAPPGASSAPANGAVWDLDPEVIPNLDELVTEDDTPVDNIFSERQQQLLVEPLYQSTTWPAGGRSFLAVANVGLFYQVGTPPIIPDVLLSLDVRLGENPHEKEKRSYFVWVHGKVPDAVVEIVSNLEGGEGDRKLSEYFRLGVRYYILHDPMDLLKGGVLRVYGLNETGYKPLAPDWLPAIGLGLRLWSGKYKDLEATWIRWCDQEGHYLPTPGEQAEQERRRAERLAAQLRALGVDPSA